MVRIIHRMCCAGGTFGGKKLALCTPKAVVIGHLCTYKGQEPDRARIAKILDWLPLQDTSDARAFMGTVSVMRFFIKDFALISRPIVELTKQSNPFQWTDREVEAFSTIKRRVETSTAIRSLEYTSGCEIILAVDSSIISVGWVIYQIGKDGKRYPCRFCSIA
jgi:hypothetical protein